MSSEIAIVMVPERAERACEMAGAVGADRAFLDSEGLGAGMNHRRAWEALSATKADWGIVLEDDAIPCDNFRSQVDQALEHAPSPIVSLYLGRGRPPHRQPHIAKAFGLMEVNEMDPCWLMSPYLNHHVGVAIKDVLIEDLCEYIPWHTRGKMPIDEIVTRWAMRGPKRLVSYSNPSLVDHDDDLPPAIKPEDRESYLHELFPGAVNVEDGTRTEKRVAWNFGVRPTWNSAMMVF